MIDSGDSQVILNLSDSQVVQESLFEDRYFVSGIGIAKRFKDPALVIKF